MNANFDPDTEIDKKIVKALVKRSNVLTLRLNDNILEDVDKFRLAYNLLTRTMAIRVLVGMGLTRVKERGGL